ncbi:HXXXD-type acyl-transferase family protein [Artemisia annua]|uniref:HXXXD-type acyl-transferase family protein n=1 Tax=Artemisia annua TaxID=35608 RepID=A0A2U1LRN5_ARTAN|nr:HXXXD-type acyl-transferase family protein [Artemisia annua]
MEPNYTPLSDIDPMLDYVKVLARCISRWKYHPAGRPNEIWSLDMVLQDPQGNCVQATVRTKENINKFQLLIDEGSCYRIENFGVDGETSLLEEPITQDATQLPNQAETQEKNMAETQQKPEDKYVHYNGIWHKIKRNHIKNKDWNSMMERVKHADEMIQRLRAAGHKITDGHMVDHNSTYLLALKRYHKGKKNEIGRKSTGGIRVMSIQNVKPDRPTPDALRSYKLSAFDQINAPSYVPFIFFYPNNSNGNTNINDIILQRSKLLKQSMSETLTKFYPFAGKYTNDIHIDCNDEGVYYVETQVDGDLSSFIAKPDYKLIPSLLPVPPNAKEPTLGYYLVMIQVAIDRNDAHKPARCALPGLSIYTAEHDHLISFDQGTCIISEFIVKDMKVENKWAMRHTRIQVVSPWPLTYLLLSLKAMHLTLISKSTPKLKHSTSSWTICNKSWLWSKQSTFTILAAHPAPLSHSLPPAAHEQYYTNIRYWGKM